MEDLSASDRKKILDAIEHLEAIGVCFSAYHSESESLLRRDARALSLEGRRGSRNSDLCFRGKEMLRG